MTLLSGIRVLDLSLQLPGPFCTMMMADYGADVVKIDEPSPRARNPFAAEDPGTGPLDRYLNRGKKSVTLDLKSAEGQEIFRKMAATADVVVEGFRPGVVKRLGVEYETLSAANPGLVYCSISGYGQTGPMRDVAGHDVNYLSYAGVLGLSGRPSEPPSLLPVQVGDVYGGSMMALSGILMALLSRQRTGKGAWIDISMTDGSIASLAIPASNLLGGGVPQERGALPLAGIAPLLRYLPVRGWRVREPGGVGAVVLAKARLPPGEGRFRRTAVRDGGVGGGGAAGSPGDLPWKDAGRVDPSLRGGGRLHLPRPVARRSAVPPQHPRAPHGRGCRFPPWRDGAAARPSDQDRGGGRARSREGAPSRGTRRSRSSRSWGIRMRKSPACARRA